MLTGRWTYRSFKNDPAPVGGDPAAALALLSGEGVFEFGETDGDRFGGGLGFGSGHALTLTGETIRLGGGREEYVLVGLGLPGTPTEGWRYDYRCSLGHVWPEAADRAPPLLGTVLRVNAHGPDAPAGATASFIAVRRKGPIPPGRVFPRNALAAGL